MIAGGKRKVGDHQKDLLEILQPALSVFVAKNCIFRQLVFGVSASKVVIHKLVQVTTATADSDELRRWNELFHSAGEMFYSWKQVCFATVPALMALTELFMIAKLTFTLCLLFLYLEKPQYPPGIWRINESLNIQHLERLSKCPQTLQNMKILDISAMFLWFNVRLLDIWSVAVRECTCQEYGGKVAILNGLTVTFVTLVTSWITARSRPCERTDYHNCCRFVTTSNCGLKEFKDFDAILVF